MLGRENLSALSDSDVFRCLAGLHMAGPPRVPPDLKSHALNTHRARFEIERAIKSMRRSAGHFGNFTRSSHSTEGGIQFNFYPEFVNTSLSESVGIS